MQGIEDASGCEEDTSTRIPLNENYVFHAEGSFNPFSWLPNAEIKLRRIQPIKYVEVSINSNHGSKLTCVYRIKVHGKYVS